MEALKRLRKQLRRCRIMTVWIYGEPLTGETKLYCSSDDATVYDEPSMEWQQMRDRIFNTPDKGDTPHENDPR